MSWNDKDFMARGIRVRHKYKRRRGCYGICERCGVKRRSTSSGWEYAKQVATAKRDDRGRVWPKLKWTTSNPPCVKR